MKLLITGVSGLIGSNVARAAAAAGHEVTGTYGNHPMMNAVRLDLTDPPAIDALVRDVRPDAVIHTAAIARPDDCARQPELCRQVNVEASRLLARASMQTGARFLHLSSDLVYGVQTGKVYEDTTELRAIGVYGGSKLDAERAVLEATAGQAFVARTSLVYGRGTGASTGFFEEWLADLRAGRRIRVFTDQFRCPTYVGDMSIALLNAAEAGLTGTFNVVGPLLCSRHEFAVWLAREFNLSESLIEPIRMADFNYSDPRPLDLHLMNDKLQAAIAYAPLDPIEGLRRLHDAMR